MTRSLLTLDTNETYGINEAAIIVAGLAWVIALGGAVVAAIILCGWRGAKQVAIDWLHMKATFTCR
jgi:hypothetical protein